MISKTKKVLISTIAGIVAVLGVCNMSHASTIQDALKSGGQLTFTYDEYWNGINKEGFGNDLFCVEHDVAPPAEGGSTYIVRGGIKLEGDISSPLGSTQGYPVRCNENGKMSYILKSGRDKHEVKYAVWKEINVWANKVLPWYTMNNGYQFSIYRDSNNNAQGLSGDNGLYAEACNKYKDAYCDVNYTEQKNYKVEDQTVKENITVTTETINGKECLRVGPFKWKYDGEIKSLAVQDQDNNSIDGVRYGTYKGTQIEWSEKTNVISSEKEFYVSIPVESGVSIIKGITGKLSIDISSVNLWLLESANDSRQNLILREFSKEPAEFDMNVPYDIPCLGNLKIVKVNKDNKSIRLNNVGFIIQQKSSGKYIKKKADGSVEYVEKDKATEFITGKDGKTGEITIEKLPIGTYIAYETKNPNYGYEMIQEGKDVEVKIKKNASDKEYENIIGNKQIYVKLSGYVWVDKPDGKKSLRNDFYKETTDELPDTKDILLDGVTVRLKNKNTGAVIKETKTAYLNRYSTVSGNNGHGEYLFEDVLIEELENYYIEFEYDGLTYQNVVPHVDKITGSKAAEGNQERENFNKDFSVVEGKTRNTGFTRDANGEEKHQLSYHINETEHKAELINNGQYTITANTETPNPKYSIEDHYEAGKEEIGFINLGLYERERPTISLLKYIENVKLEINGYNHTYLYGSRFKNAGQYEDGFNVGVKFAVENGASYTRAIYKADYNWENPEDRNKELKAYIIYKIDMKNQSTNLKAQVNSIVDYYDSKYELGKIGTRLDENGEIVEDIDREDTISYNEDYNKVVIYNNSKIDPNQITSIYVQFKLSREQVASLLRDKNAGEQADELLNNVAEINSYSIYDNKGNVYAGIDTQSNPGNCVPGESNTYENDTDESPALRLEVAGNARQMTGKVFLDETENRLMTGEIRQGSGAYEEGEKGIEGVEVTLTENTGSGQTYTATTNSEGDFLIEGYIPGDYTVTYTWGDETYTVQDYKGTVYDKARYERNQNNLRWWHDEADGTRYTDAIDNYDLRKQIDKDENTITTMKSTTPTMGIGVEYETAYTASDGDRYTYVIKNIDFGIVERARQAIDIGKEVTAVKITLANGQTIVDAQIVDGKLQGEFKGLTYMPPANGSNGMVKAEMDNELIQGANVQIEYTIHVDNKSELDYDSKNYYQYGTIEGNVITIKPEGVYDYLDSQMVLDERKDNTDWEIVSKEEYNNQYSEPTKVEGYFNEGKTTHTKPDGTVIDVYKWETSEEKYQTLFTEWATQITERRTIRDAKLENKTILHNAKLEKELAPKETNSVKLYTSKVLSNTDEIDLNNDTEIVQTRHNETTGRIPDPSGSYMYDRGETVVVTTPTGENKDYMVPIMIGSMALILLGVGVIIIKKKVF